MDPAAERCGGNLHSMLVNSNRVLAKLRLSAAGRYGLAIAFVLLATPIRWLLTPKVGLAFPFATYYPAVVLVAWIGGLGPALLATTLALLLADFLFIPPLHSFAIFSNGDTGLSLLFALVGLVSGVMSEAYRRALQSSERAYELVARQQAELQQIYATTPIGLGFLNEELRYLRVNDALAAFNGVPTEEHPGKHVSEILSPATTAKLLPYLQQVLETGKAITNLEFEGTHTRGSDEKRHVRASFYPAQLGALRGVHGVVEDVTAEKNAAEELKRVEEQLRYAVKMDAVGRLAGGIAHEFNNLLMVISSYTELLEPQLAGNADHARKIRAIASATQRAARLTQQLLAFGRKQPMQVQTLDLDMWIRSFESILSSTLRDDIELKLQLSAAGASVNIDPSLLEQCLTSLAVNARDAMPEGGSVTVVTSRRTFADDEIHASFTIPAGEWIQLEFSDCGCGISEEIRAKIFDPFFTTKEQGRGSGLGLAMVYGIVKQSGGFIEASSAERQGTTFCIWLPVCKEAAAHKIEPAPAPKSGTGTILLVEDEAALRAAVCESLRGLGYDVIEAGDGLEALGKIEQAPGRFDLLISDAVMPKLGGIDLIQRVRVSHPNIKTILISGYADTLSPGSLPPQLGEAVMFLQKPFSQDELSRAISQVLSKHQ